MDETSFTTTDFLPFKGGKHDRRTIALVTAKNPKLSPLRRPRP